MRVHFQRISMLIFIYILIYLIICGVDDTLKNNNWISDCVILKALRDSNS